MQFELQMTGRRRVGVVNLDFVEVDRQRRARSASIATILRQTRKNLTHFVMRVPGETSFSAIP